MKERGDRLPHEGKIVDDKLLRKVAERVAVNAKRKTSTEQVYYLGKTFIKRLTNALREGDELPIRSFSTKKNPRVILKKKNGKIFLQRH